MSGHEATVACVLVLVLAAMNLRGVRESGAFFAVPTYGFMIGVARDGDLRRHPRRAGQPARRGERRSGASTPAPGYGGDISQAAMIFLLARAFSSGCAA